MDISFGEKKISFLSSQNEHENDYSLKLKQEIQLNRARCYTEVKKSLTWLNDSLGERNERRSSLIKGGNIRNSSCKIHEEEMYVCVVGHYVSEMYMVNQFLS